MQRPAVTTAPKRGLRPAIALIAALLVAGLLAGPAAAEIRKSTGLHNDRYCEIFELKGVPPVSTVDVWNTIGLNNCPPEWWDNLDTTKIAAENGDTLVLKNGPRHWLMDSAKGDVGGVKDFEGQKLRHVATIPLESPADLQQTSYTERTIARTNTWHWKQGRRVYELVNPQGVHYLMQSYSQIIDPELKAADLATLGDRLELPEGWRYKMRRLHEPLTLRADGSATILQDDLKNTYQRVVQKPTGKRRVVAVRGMTKLAGMSSPGVLNDKGTITGRPFGAGTIDIHVRFEGQGKASGDFAIETERGNAYGTVDLSFVISGGEIDFTGTADFTSGTGRYRHITGTDLKAHDHNTLDGQNGEVELDGFARF